MVRAGLVEVDRLPHLHGEVLRLNGVAARGLQLLRADQSHRNDRRARRKGQPADAGPAAVQDTVAGAGALRVDADAPAVLEDVQERLEGLHAGGLLAALDRYGAYRGEEGLHHAA